MKFLVIPLLLILVCFDVDAGEIPDCSSVKNDNQYALACNIYWEGRNQSFKGMLSIASVTLNRVKDPTFPDTPAKVVWQRGQFSWTFDGKRDKPYRNEQQQWNWAMGIARMFTVSKAEKSAMCPEISSTRKMWDILEEQGVPVTRRSVGCHAYDKFKEYVNQLVDFVDPTNGATFFHADYVKPRWRKAFERVIKVGTHIFYRKKDSPT